MSDPKPFAWSYSRVQQHETCGYQYLEKIIRKNPLFEVDPAPPLIHGRRVHGGMAAYLTGGENGTYYAEQEKTTYTADMRFEAKKYAHFAHVIEEIRRQMPLVEQQWGYDRDYKPASWFGTKDRPTFFRSILDAGVLWPSNHFSNADWKTGRPKEDHLEQMETQALAVFARYPQVHWVETRLFYMDIGTEQHNEFLRKDFSALVEKWNKRAKAVENDKTYVPRPGSACRYCPLAKSKGGPCAFS